MKTKTQCLIADLFIALHKARDNAEELDGRRATVKDLRTDLFTAGDILNKISRLTEEKRAEAKDDISSKIEDSIYNAIDLTNKLCRLEEIDEEV